MSDSTIKQLEEEIKQLEALKEGATPGPWKVRRDKWGGGLDCPEIISNEDNLCLAAASPALVDALIAEKRAHQKLRAEVAEQRDVYAEDGDSIGANQAEQLTFEAHRQVARDLTEILEGNND